MTDGANTRYRLKIQQRLFRLNINKTQSKNKCLIFCTIISQSLILVKVFINIGLGIWEITQLYKRSFYLIINNKRKLQLIIKENDNQPITAIFREATVNIA